MDPFEKILERLEELIEKSYYEFTEGSHHAGIRNSAYRKVNKIIHKVAEEYNNGWIPISDRLPENDKYILLSFDNFSVPMIGRYEGYESGGAFYIGDEDTTCSKQDLFVNAWQPLPEPYQPKGE